jgi:hypothetical protein
MAIKLKRQTSQFSTVTPGKTSTLSIAPGVRVHKIVVKAFTANTDYAGHLSDFQGLIDGGRLKVNGKVQREFTQQDLDYIQGRNGNNYLSGLSADGKTLFQPIFLAEPWRPNAASREAFAWGTGNIASLQLEIDVSSDAPDDFALSAEYVFDNAVDAKGNAVGMGAIVKWFKTNVQMTGTSILIEDPVTARDPYQEIVFFDDTITAVNLKVDNTEVFDNNADENNTNMYNDGMEPDNGAFSLVFDHDDKLDSVLPPTGTHTYKFTRNDATPVSVPVTYLTVGAPE